MNTKSSVQLEGRWQGESDEYSRRGVGWRVDEAEPFIALLQSRENDLLCKCNSQAAEAFCPRKAMQVMRRVMIRTINLLRRVILDKNCRSMNLSTVKGYLGELLVRTHLESEGLAVQHRGNQSGYDLEFEYKGRVIKLDVKFSTFKTEYDRKRGNWAWALVHQNKKRNLSCTHLVCVAVDDRLDIVNLFVIPAAYVEMFPRGAGQFSRVKHCFIRFKNSIQPSGSENWFDSYDASQRLLNDGKVIRVGKNKRLCDVLAAGTSDLEDALELDDAVRAAKNFRNYDEIRAELRKSKRL